MPDDTLSDLDAPDVAAALRRTAPVGLSPVDTGLLAQRDRRRRRRRTVLASAAAVLTLGAAAGVVVAASADDPPEVDVADGSLTEPVGTWRQAADPPFEPRMGAFTGPLSDGRLLVWGGSNDMGEGSMESFSDGGIYDPATDTWEEIPAPPVIAPAGGGAGRSSVHLVDDKLAVAVASADYQLDAAVFDVAEGSWEVAPEQDQIPDIHDAMAWDGETMVLVRTSSNVSQIDQPVTVRWQMGDDSWTSGAPFPLGVRDMPGVAFDGSQLALWGGTDFDGPIGDDEDQVAFDDGAIYDVAGDTWHPTTANPRAATSGPELMWSGGRLLVMQLGDEEARAPEAYDPAAETWETLPEPPAGFAIPLRPGNPLNYVEGEDLLLAGGLADGSDEQAGRWFYSEDGWEQAPLTDLHRIGDRVVADTQTVDDPGSGPFELYVRDAPDLWAAAAEAPFGNRMGASMATNDNALLVVGGSEGEDLRLQGDAWVFDLDG